MTRRRALGRGRAARSSATRSRISARSCIRASSSSFRHERLDCGRHGRSELVAGAERRALDPEHEQRSGSRPSARPSSTTSATPNACVEPRKTVAGTGSTVASKPVHRAGLRARRDRVDEQREVGSLPGVEQLDRLLLAHDHLELGRARANALGDREADGVVAAEGVADADHDRPHSRSTSRSRKWVAQEMHGS